ncbi:MAG TPA: YjbE family putative metal transport protein [Chloroflexota bacterium]|nr:YjbE family putative metal transport protein [Chloroflexota bacterium]
MWFSGDLLARIVQIILIDLVLSGDNAVVIGMAAHPLPRRQRQMAILFGGLAALVLRIALTAVAALLLDLPALKAIGGLLLLWIAYRLLEVEQSDDGKPRQASTLRGAIGTILVADFVMSLDNVLGVAAASNSDVVLLIFGLVVSMAIVMLGGSIFASLIDRLWWLAYLGALVLAWTGCEMIQEDALVSRMAELPMLARWAVDCAVSVAVVALAHWAHRRLPALQRSA